MAIATFFFVFGILYAKTLGFGAKATPPPNKEELDRTEGEYTTEAWSYYPGIGIRNMTFVYKGKTQRKGEVGRTSR